VPYNYYFLDCDATGQVFDDFSPGHRLSKQADAAERLERLRWISRNFVAAVGSEGGHSFASMAVDVGEGVMAPYFGWDDPSLKDRKSPFFRGAYYPPDEPAVFFKPVPLAERFEKVYFDPRYKIPLFNAALHDSIVVTAHWNNGAFKYEKLFPQRELLSLLYLQPLMFHLNLEEWARRSHDIRRYYEAWSPLHKRFGFAPQLNFQVLDPDGLVQQTTYGNDESTSVAERCVITVNLGKKAYSLQEGLVIPAMSAWIEAPSVWEKGRVFSAGQPAAKHD